MQAAMMSARLRWLKDKVGGLLSVKGNFSVYIGLVSSEYTNLFT
jgi:hypothetical protein